MRAVHFFALALALSAAPAAAADFRLHSPDLTHGGRLPAAMVANAFGCAGGNVSPQLRWENPPAGTKSYVVTAYDPDAPTGSGFWHWVVTDIPAAAAGLAPGAGSGGAPLPDGATSTRNDAGQTGFFGACPPPGDPPHRYIFTVHALKTDKLGLPADSSGALVGFMTHMNRLGQASLTVTYGR